MNVMAQVKMDRCPIRIKEDISYEFNEFKQLMARGQMEKACMASPEGYFGEGEKYLKAGDLGKAFDAFALVVKHAKRDITRAQALNSIGIIQGLRLQFKEAAAALDEARSLDKRSAAIALNLAIAHRWQGDLKGALRCVEAAGRINPRLHETRLFQAEVKMMMGNYAEAWSEYESRLGKSTHKFNMAPEWTGQSLKGKNIFIYREQGFGDMLLMLRYLPIIQSMGARIFLSIPPELERLLDPWWGKVCFKPFTESVDFELPMMSLPLRCGTRIDNIPPAPFLPFPAAHTKEDCVALVWAGSSSNPIDYGRSFGIEPMKTLLDLPTKFVSLQVGPRKFDAIGLNIVQAEPNDFYDTANILSRCKALVTCDTSVAHLAGAIGTPVLVPVSKYGDWRYGLEGKKAPWYGDNMEIYRQRIAGDWSQPFAEVKARLKELL